MKWKPIQQKTPAAQTTLKTHILVTTAQINVLLLPAEEIKSDSI